MIVAEKNSERILVEVKTINKAAVLYHFYAAYGQYEFYRDQLFQNAKDQTLYLAISKEIHEEVEKFEQLSNWLVQHKVNLLVVDTLKEMIEKWIKY